MTVYFVSIKFAQFEREVYVNARSESDAIARVRKTLVGQEARWASVFVG